LPPGAILDCIFCSYIEKFPDWDCTIRITERFEDILNNFCDAINGWWRVGGSGKNRVSGLISGSI